MFKTLCIYSEYCFHIWIFEEKKFISWKGTDDNEENRGKRNRWKGRGDRALWVLVFSVLVKSFELYFNNFTQEWASSKTPSFALNWNFLTGVYSSSAKFVGSYFGSASSISSRFHRKWCRQRHYPCFGEKMQSLQSTVRHHCLWKWFWCFYLLCVRWVHWRTCSKTQADGGWCTWGVSRKCFFFCHISLEKNTTTPCQVDISRIFYRYEDN